MQLLHIPQCTIQNRNVHIFVLNIASWDVGGVHCGICELDQLRDAERMPCARKPAWFKVRRKPFRVLFCIIAILYHKSYFDNLVRPLGIKFNNNSFNGKLFGSEWPSIPTNKIGNMNEN